jgi:MYXO-CTERM domain-containing protein
VEGCSPADDGVLLLLLLLLLAHVRVARAHYCRVHLTPRHLFLAPSPLLTHC